MEKTNAEAYHGVSSRANIEAQSPLCRLTVSSRAGTIRHTRGDSDWPSAHGISSVMFYHVLPCFTMFYSPRHQYLNLGGRSVKK